MSSKLVVDNGSSRDSSITRRSSASDEKQTSSFNSAEIPKTDSNASTLQQSLLTYEDIPDWYQDNPHIRRGYRPVSHSARACFGSWSYAHNESMNIYTHLVPAVALLVCGLVYVLARLRTHVGGGDAGVVTALMLSEVLCLGISSTYHTLLCHSREVESIWLRLDFVGIILLILGSFVSSIYVNFWCEKPERTIYWSISGSLAIISIIIVVAPAFQGLRWRNLRLLTFVCTGLSGLAPIIHGIYMFGFGQMLKQSGLPYYLTEGCLFLIGAVVYATRFPESVHPGKFDIYGSSHQIFHVLVVIATAAHLAGVLEAIEYNRYNRQCPIVL